MGLRTIMLFRAWLRRSTPLRSMELPVPKAAVARCARNRRELSLQGVEGQATRQGQGNRNTYTASMEFEYTRREVSSLRACIEARRTYTLW